MPRPAIARTWGFVLMAFGLFVLALADDRVPARSDLTEISGRLRSLEKATSKGGSLGSVRFSLTTDPRHLRYHSAAGQIDAVWDALNRAGQAEVRVLVDPADAHSPPFDERRFYAVLEVAVGGETIQSYAQVAESLRDNRFVGEVLGYGAIAIGVGLLAFASMRRRAD